MSFFDDTLFISINIPLLCFLSKETLNNGPRVEWGIEVLGLQKGVVYVSPIVSPISIYAKQKTLVII